MTQTRQKGARRQQILESLAHMLEANPGARITTAALAKEVGVSEAALYRHFPSKSKMFEGLIEFIEETIFSRITLIMQGEGTALQRCEKIIFLMLTFAEKNPGISRILNGDALAGETERLRTRIAQLFARLETQFKQILREAEVREGVRTSIPTGAAANMLSRYLDGAIAQFVRSEFRTPPTENWSQHWPVLSAGFMRETAAAL